MKVDEMSCLEKLNSEGLAFILNGIMECVERKTISEEEAIAMKKIEADSREIAGRKISSFASAVLNYLNVKQYSGCDEDVISLISSWSHN